MRVSRVGTEELAPTAEVTVTVHNSDGTSVSKTTTVGFYDRSAKVGDYVYADGSYSDVFDDLRTVVAICFYVDPEDNSKRLAVAKSDAFGGGVPWGLTSAWFSGIKLVDYPEYPVYNLMSLPDKLTSGVTSALTETDYLSSETPDGFAVFSESTALGQIGFGVLDEDVAMHSVGEVLPIGLINTLKIIKHRNRVLGDSGIALPIPERGADQVSMQNFLSALAQNRANHNSDSHYDQYYWPAASIAYAYEPKVKPTERLADSFKNGNWALPALGDVARIRWYQSKGYDATTEGAIFAKAYANRVFTPLKNMSGSSQECDAGKNYCMQDLNVKSIDKSAAVFVRPIIQF